MGSFMDYLFISSRLYLNFITLMLLNNKVIKAFSDNAKTEFTLYFGYEIVLFIVDLEMVYYCLIALNLYFALISVWIFISVWGFSFCLTTIWIFILVCHYINTIQYKYKKIYTYTRSFFVQTFIVRRLHLLIIEKSYLTLMMFIIAKEIDIFILQLNIDSSSFFLCNW